MDIYVTDLETGSRFRFPMMPETIQVQTGATFYSYQIINVGDIRLPSGEQLTGFSWSALLPGEQRKNDPYVHDWQDPHAIQSQWSFYRKDKKKLRLLATETPINHNVYLENYNVEYAGGHGDYSYTISFIQAKDLKVYASGASGESSSTAETDVAAERWPLVENKPLGVERPSPPAAGTYTVAKGDTLWGIAQKFFGSGARYPEIQSSNKDVIGSDPNKIYPGQTLTIVA
jgi:nucleoid-associated protein YgaU